ncbi:MAG: hypothetical protein ACR2K0_04120 [Acidimicrobiales bacterium]
MCRRGVGTGATRDGRRPVLAGLAVVVLLVAGWPAADVVAHLGGVAPLVAPARAGAGVTGAGAPAPAPTAGDQVHLVQPGETYWSIVEDLGVAGDARPEVDALMAANGGRPLEAGDALMLPATRPVAAVGQGDLSGHRRR